MKSAAELKAYRKEWQLKNRDRVRALRKAHYAANRESIISQERERRRNNPEHCKEIDRKSHKKHREKLLASEKIWRNKHPERVKEYRRQYYLKYKSKYLEANARRRALIAGASVNIAQIEAWVKEITSKKSAICYYCQKRVPISQIHFDHIVALFKGGPHSIENLCVSCATCNHIKHTRKASAFIKIGQTLLEL